ncbi:MAG: hypothetical protein AAGG57_06015 [Pseudomonadota bacterium]
MNDPTVVGTIDNGLWPWLEKELAVRSVNGISLDRIEDLSAVLRSRWILRKSSRSFCGLELRLAAHDPPKKC